jgi:hypothetical protein
LTGKDHRLILYQNSTDFYRTILNYALTLEHLEATLYRQAIQNFTEADFTNAGFNGSMFYQTLKEVGRDEQIHVEFLTTALKAAGVAPVAECTYDFGMGKALTPASFLALASVIEGVGVSAYLGAAALITNKAYLTAAASILTVEARHSAFIRGSLSQLPVPQPFDIPLDFDQVYSLAAPFIVSCPSTNAKLPVKAFPSLSVGASVTMPIKQGDTIEFDLAASCTIPSGPLFLAFPLADGTMFSSVVVKDGKIYARIPVGHTGPNGEVFAILTTNDTAVTDDNTIAGPAIVEVAPFMAAM